MVLTRRARKCILRWLPNELVSEIIAFSSFDTQLALCRVCKLFNQLAVISLYRAVDLGSYSKFAQFAESLSSNTRNAIHVVSLRLYSTSLESEEDVAELPDDYSIFNSLSRLETLCLFVSLGETICVGLFRECTFPRLTEFRYIAPQSLVTAGMLTHEILLSFIRRHSEITRLVAMDGSPAFPASVAREEPASQLQKLRQFVGPAYLLEFLPLGINQIFLFSGDEEQTDTLQQLSRLTAQGTDLAYSNIFILRGTIARTLSMIATHLPRIVSIQLRWGKNPDRWLDPENIQAISQSLENFPALRYLTFHYIAFLDVLKDGNRLPVDEYNADRQVVERWGKSCPSLRECCFHGNGWRRDEGASEWISCVEDEMKERPDIEFIVR
ncbi:hypothetical protein FB45DRAFT_869184 [Roridomyces roridus]|uniref:F-box domain-containing protein n=1 Tax=Roridomyces roridus TaxID=1738132 RepID=A0AAD7BNF6_9AGAR|nr:hypothetical protein FB45DRAFT_869184 [Roridomyces roridus]